MAISPGLLAGIGAGLDAGTANYFTGQQQQQQTLLNALRMQALQGELQDAAMKRQAIANAAKNLGIVGGALNPPSAPPTPYTFKVPDMTLGVDTELPTGLPPGGLPNVANGIVPPAANIPTEIPMSLPSAAPQPPRTTQAALAQPGVTEAYTGLLRAGIRPFGEGGVFKSPEDYSKEIKARDDREQGLKDLQGAAEEYAAATDSKGRVGAILKLYGAEAKANGKVGDTASILKSLTSEQELEAMATSSAELQPIQRKILNGTATADDLAKGLDIIGKSKSSGFRTAMEPFIQKYVADMPGLAANQRFHELEGLTPEADPLDLWKQVTKEMPQQAGLAEQQNHLPITVKNAIVAQQAFAAGRQHQAGIEAGKTQQDKDLERRLKEAQATNLENAPSKAETTLAGQQTSYDRMYEGDLKSYDMLASRSSAGSLKVPPPPAHLWDAMRRPDALYKERYGKDKPPLTNIAIERGNQILRANGFDPNHVEKIPPAAMRGLASALEAEGLPIPPLPEGVR